ncbi:hypothetical protein [Streptomyces rhizosphaerihabitans]|uniref:hypothetical protein n=1 Tax=Streptomyces rhizosphaerihabitans TaxID=1266770 RepID=UPI0021C11965|nr:hypothetical protein [Streptomyces rhizosphaerihabitans]MCT9004618.1 hypothetical protein [Streptomyces rhizosphaerihabitans]
MEDPGVHRDALVHPTSYCITSFITPVGTAELLGLRFELSKPETELAPALLGSS